jgi:glycosyltransferase involved in cell wall biosynthesis
MRVLVLSQYFWPETFRINEVVTSLREAGCEVTVLTGQPNYPEGVVQAGYRAASLRRDTHDGMPVLRVPLAPRGRRPARLALNYLSFVVSAALFGPWLLRGRRFDAVLVYAPSPILQAIPAVWLAWLKRAPLATWVQDLWPQSLSATGYVRHAGVLAAIEKVVRWIYRRNELLLVQSEAFVEPVKALAGLTPVVYHPNPGERAFGAASSSRPPPLQLTPGFNVVFAGNLGTAQALETIVSAALLLRDEASVRFVLVGNGSRSDWLQEQVQRHGLTNLQLPGRFTPDEMPGILSQASALLVTLSRDPIFAQTVPSKVQAYLAAGKPIIAALDGEGARIVLAAGAGVACPAEDAAALAAAVRSLMAQPASARAQMAESGQRYYAQNFEPGLLAQRLVARLATLAGASGIRIAS